ncbi:MAG: hypothetical protein D3916_03180 [Candidatus Electrothrix sp. MAN1_4]|nr:hypothetical protein [Candidatus Electrothrix sp. MAN1_4]
MAIIAAGIVSIILGYKLFAGGAAAQGGTGINVQHSGFKIIFRNVAPGVLFAGFGAFIIHTMLSQGNPELVLKDVQTVIKDSQGNSQSEVQTRSASTKGNGNSNNKRSEAVRRFDQSYNEGVKKQRSGNAEAAITAYNRALSESEVSLGKAAVVFNALAWSYRTQQQIDEALALARIATTVAPDNANAFDTLALILLDKKEFNAAELAAEKAVKLDPAKQDYKNTQQQVHEAQGAGE